MPYIEEQSFGDEEPAQSSSPTTRIEEQRSRPTTGNLRDGAGDASDLELVGVRLALREDVRLDKGSDCGRWPTSHIVVVTPFTRRRRQLTDSRLLPT